MSRVCVDRPRKSGEISLGVCENRRRKSDEEEYDKAEEGYLDNPVRDACARPIPSAEGVKDISPGTVPVFKIHVQSLLP